MADSGNHTIRRIVISSGAVTTFAGTAGSNGSVDGTGTEARFDRPAGITTDGANLYVTGNWDHIIRKIEISTAGVITLAGTAGISGRNNGPGSDALFYQPYGITFYDKKLYISEVANHAVRILSP